MSRVASSRASVLSSSSSTPSASAASAHITADGRDDAGQSTVHSFTEKEEMTSTQPHILTSRSTSSPPSALTPVPTVTPKPQGLRALSQTSASRSPKRQKREDFQHSTEEVMPASSSRPSGDEPTTVVPVSSSSSTTASDVIGRRPRQGDVQSPALPPSNLHSPPQVSASSSIVTDATAAATPLLQHAPCLPQRSPRQPLLQRMSSVSASTGVFEVMLNHARVRVDRRYPFLNPTSLFTAHTTSSANCGESVEGLDPPLHRYGHRPVLLLDYTGMLHLRHQRRARRQEILAQVQHLLAERQDQIRSARAWRMRLLRATRGNKASITHKERASSTDEASGTTGESDAGSKSETSDEERENDHDNDVRREEEPDNADVNNANTEEERRNADENVLYTHADVMRLIGATGERRAAITRELVELRTELRELAHAKQLGAANREGCVLMLPSPGTQEVRLCSGHHYRTVCFVGEELMDVVPGEGPVPRPVPQRDPSTRPPVSPERHDVAPPRLNRESGREGEDRARRDDSQQPLWATAEVSGYAIYARQRQHETRRKRRRSSGDGGDGGHEAEEDGESDEAPATLDAFLALPACEAAMYREWAIRKHSPSSPET